MKKLLGTPSRTRGAEETYTIAKENGRGTQSQGYFYPSQDNCI